MTQQLIPVFNGALDGRTQQLCDARDLHEYLGVGRHFSNWIKDRIEDYGLGSVDVSAEPQQGCSEGQHRLEMTGLFLKTRSNPPVMLQFAEQALHDVALFIKIPVA